MYMTEIEVFSLTSFDKDKCYGFALRTRKSGDWRNEKSYTTNPIKYLGKHIKSERWGFGDGSGGAETFEKDRIEYDYDGKTCFIVVPCTPTGGKRKYRLSRKNKKSKKNNSKKNKSRKNRRKSSRRR